MVRIAPTLMLATALPLLAAASVVPRTDTNQCNTGPVQCCNELQQASALPSSIAGLLGLILGPITGLVGTTCTPITAIGVGGNSCTTQPVCCTNNSFNGLVAVGCTPINVNL